MQNFVLEGKTLELVAPYNVLSGDGLLVTNIFEIAATDATYDPCHRVIS